MKKLLLMALAAIMAINVMAQRTMDKLDRGLVAIKTDAGVFCSWRIFGEEYYDVKYNIYRDGTKLNAEPLAVSNYVDATGTTSSKYTVSAVVRGDEKAQCDAASVWTQKYLEITPENGGIKSTLVPNDACMADVDGDGELEILMKFDNQSEVTNCMQKEGYFGEYSIFKVFKLDGTLLWWVNCGPNMGDFQNNEQNIVAYDWDQDGKAEALMRLEEGSVIHMADGTTYTIGADGQNGTTWTNYREPRGLSSGDTTVAIAFGLSSNATVTTTESWLTTKVEDGVLYAKTTKNPKVGDGTHTTGRTGYINVKDGSKSTQYSVFQLDQNSPSVEWFTHYGKEFLVYCNGMTGTPYVVKEFPLKRLEDGETDLKTAWGDGYGHRSSKFFYGAPYLDGRKPSIFLARGIYTRHKMIAYDVNPTTHELIERWRWNNNTEGSAWYGQGYHNYAVADVDWDGRDEICFGSMVIDDNGHGLSTTGLGHGDAQHHGDFNPYIHGHEIYACNEDAPDNNYRDATTSKIYYRQTSGKDDGRAMMGNFSNDYPGCLGRSGHDTAISSVTNNHIPKDIAFDVNFRIYWDGDLLEETFNGTGTSNSAGRIYKPSTGKTIETLAGSLTNNDTKATPCYQGDILGDWREEVIMRTADNKIRIYSTTIPTEWRNYTLWHDMQYRQAMVWQMCGYNQPPHVSYFIGELEGITQAPPALTMTNRVEIANEGSISSEQNEQQVIMAETNNMTVSIADGVKPYIFFDNAASHVIGHDNNNNIEYVYYKHTLTGGAFTGDMRLVKQGDGVLELPNVIEKYSGNTEVWAGTLIFNGTLENSHLWLNRHTTLETDGGQFKNGIEASYNTTIHPGGKANIGTMTTTTLALGFGSRIVFDINADGTGDHVTAEKLIIEKKDWQYGPEYSCPVFQINGSQLEPGNYTLVKADQLEGEVANLVIEGLSGVKYEVKYDNGNIILTILPMRSPTEIVWDGGNDGIWNFAETENYIVNGEKDFFVTGDNVVFNDNTNNTTINLVGELQPGSVTFENDSKDYTLQGDGTIIGSTSLTKKGKGNVTINNVNKFTGGVNIEDGKLIVASLANKDGAEYGALGGVSNKITFNGGTLSVKNNIVTTQPVSITDGNGTVEVASGSQLTLNGAISGSLKELTKTGAGTLVLNGTASYGTLNLNQGTIQGGESSSSTHQYPSTIVLNGGTLKDPDNIYSYSTNNANIVVPEGKSATWTLDSRCDYKGKLTGKGTLTVNVTSVRCNMQGDWSQFEGTIIFKNTKTGSYDPSIEWNNTKGLGNATVTGTFNNNGKNVSIGTIQGDATLTGSGTYTAKNLSLKVTRGRGNSTNTKISVANTLSVTGSIDVTWTGTQPKLGEEVTLWTVGKLSTTSALEINLPTLPSGLYWDTSDLLKATGVLRVTNQPTGITNVDMDKRNDGYYYTLDGVRIDNPTKKGIYIKNGKKIIIK